MDATSSIWPAPMFEKIHHIYVLFWGRARAFFLIESLPAKRNEKKKEENEIGLLCIYFFLVCVVSPLNEEEEKKHER